MEKVQGQTPFSLVSFFDRFSSYEEKSIKEGIRYKNNDNFVQSRALILSP